MNTTTAARTVLGEIDPRQLGVTLPHEHLIHQTSLHSHKADNTCIDVELVVDELKIFRAAGGGTICDVTPIGIGRDPKALEMASRLSGVNVVSALGVYQMEVWPDFLRPMTREQLADFLVREAAGESTGIAAGFLGEIASHNEPHHSDWRQYRLWNEERVLFQAVADAQRRTGLFISTHASLGRHGVDQLRTIIEAGGDPNRVVIGHCDAHAHDDIDRDFDYYHTLLREGAWLEFDLFGWDELILDTQRFERVAMLVKQGFSDRLLLSTDICRLSQLHRHGGHGFDYLFTTVLPGLRSADVSEDAIQQMTVTNPARMLTPV